MEESNFYIKITNKIFSIILFFSSISIFLVLFSFHPEDPGWGFVSENVPKNFYGEIGSFFSGLVIREFGILPGLFLSSILFMWSLKLFNETKIKFIKTKHRKYVRKINKFFTKNQTKKAYKICYYTLHWNAIRN